MAYTAWSVVYGEQPTAAKWNQLGANDAGFKDGTNIDNLAIVNRHIGNAAVMSKQAKLSIVGADGATVNPLPTTRTDVPSSSLTFNCDVASYLLMTVSSTLQNNVATNAYVLLFVDGVEQGRTVWSQGNGTGGLRFTAANTYRITLAAGSHTIKLQVLADTATSAVAYNPSWWGVLVAQ